MSKVKNNGDGESIYPFIPFSSFENSSISSSFPLIFKNGNDGPIDEELEMDDPFFFYDPNNPPIFHDQGVIISENPFIQLEDEGAEHGETRNHDEVLLLPILPNASALLDERELVESGSNLLDTATQLAFLTPWSSYEPKEPETLKKEATEKFDDMDRILVDTAAPFESVREAVSKFGGIVDCKAEERLSIEKQKQIQLELKKVQEEVLKHRKRFHDEETAKAQVLEEVDRCKGLVEELNHRLEREATLEKQAKQDCELADMRLREVEQGISDDSSVASKVQLVVANERHASAVVESKSVKEEFESIQTAYASLLRERDVAIEKAAASFAAFKKIKHTIQNLALKLIITKQLLESVRVVHFKAEDQTLVAALELEIEKLVRDKLLKHAEEELQHVAEQILMTNALKLELDRTSTLLADLKAELALENQAVSVAHTEGFEEARSYIEKSNQGVNCLKAQLSSLVSELEREKTSLSSLEEREDLTSASIASLEAELNRMNTELELVLKREGAGDLMTSEEKAKLLQAAKEVEEAKFLANLEREELRKDEEEVTRAEIKAMAMELRLRATLNEIEAAKKVNAWDENGVDFFSNAVTLTLEEYNGLSEKAKEVEKQAKERTIAATEQMETAKECETKSLEKLGEARKALEEKKKKLREAMARAEKVEEERLLVEHELRTYKGKHKHEPTTRFGSFDGSVDLGAAAETTSSFCKADGDSQCESSTRCTGGLVVHSDNKIVSKPKPKQRKRMFFARILMFLARKKVQSLK